MKQQKKESNRPIIISTVAATLAFGAFFALTNGASDQNAESAKMVSIESEETKNISVPEVVLASEEKMILKSSLLQFETIPFEQELITVNVETTTVTPTTVEETTVEKTTTKKPKSKKSKKSKKKKKTEVATEKTWGGPVLTRSRGTIQGPSGKETYYNLNMSRVVSIMQSKGYNYNYWVREDGVKMFGDYVMCAANLNIRPKGTIIETSLGKAIVCDTGGFANYNTYQVDIAVSW